MSKPEILLITPPFHCGVVEVAGRCRPLDGARNLAPPTQRPCVWWHYRIQKRASSGPPGKRRTSWHTVNAGRSEQPFLLINPEGLWRRSQSSWHYGAGQDYSDASDSEVFRFNTSKGVNVWEKGRLTFLPATIQSRSSANTNLHMATAGTRIYITDGQTVAYTTNLTSFTTVTGTNASNLVDITSDGYNVFFSYADGNIDQTDSSTGAASNYITGITAGRMDYAKGRLMVAGAGSDSHKIWNITTTPGSSANNSHA